MPLRRLICAPQRKFNHLGGSEAMSAIAAQEIGYQKTVGRCAWSRNISCAPPRVRDLCAHKQGTGSGTCALSVQGQPTGQTNVATAVCSVIAIGGFAREIVPFCRASMSLAYLLLFLQSILVRLGFRPASAGVWSERGSPWPRATSIVVGAVDTRRDKSPGDQCRGGFARPRDCLPYRGQPESRRSLPEVVPTARRRRGFAPWVIRAAYSTRH